jgi:hypothetical protein
MTPEEKAKELFKKFRNEILSFLGDKMKDKNAKRCALIAVDEILNINSVDKDFSLSHYWLDVKDEIENL